MYPYYKGPDRTGIDYDDVMAMYELYSESVMSSSFVLPVKTQTEEEYKEWTKSRNTTTTTENPTTTATPDKKKEQDKWGKSKETDDKERDGPVYDYVADEGDSFYNSGSLDVSSTTTTTTTSTTMSTSSKTTPQSTTTRVASTTSTATYVGDYEDLDSHVARRGGRDPGPADLCSGTLDSLALLRGELFAFVGRYMWRFSGRGHLRPGYPAPTAQMFNFPK